jgi:hypothetical protein
LRAQKTNPLFVSNSRRSPFNARRHHSFPIRIQTRQGFQSGNGFQSEHVWVVALEVTPDFQPSR